MIACMPCISENDDATGEGIIDKLHNVEFLPTFPAWQKVCGSEGQDNLASIIGNLSVPENEEAAAWLICKCIYEGKNSIRYCWEKPS